MNHQSYISHVRSRLMAHGFAEASEPTGAGGSLPLVLERTEHWGRLLLALAPPDMQEQPDRGALAAAAAAWIQGMSGPDGEARCYLILVFPFAKTVPHEESEEIRSLLQEDGRQRWGLIPWVADLEVELIDQHSGFPRIDQTIARALTEVPRSPMESAAWRAAGPRIGAGSNYLGGLGYMPATRFILAATVSYYLWVLTISAGLGGLLTGPTLPQLLRWGANHGQLVLFGGQPWRLVTHLLLHGGLIHLGLNMWVLWQLGRHVELVFGTRRMLFIYVVAGVSGGLASTVLRPQFVPSVGASGAILGLMGALLYFARAMPGRSVHWRDLAGPVAINLLYGFFMRGLIDNYAHLGGFVGGMLAAFLAGIPGERDPWRMWAMAGVSLVIGLAVAGVLPLPHWPLGF